MKDEKGRTIMRDKKVYDGNGTYKWEHYKVWKRTVVNDPLGETARRAMEEGDEDLKELAIDNIPIQSNEEVEQVEVVNQNFPERTEDQSESVRIKQNKRKGFLSTEESKGLK